MRLHIGELRIVENFDCVTFFIWPRSAIYFVNINGIDINKIIFWFGELVVIVYPGLPLPCRRRASHNNFRT